MKDSHDNIIYVGKAKRLKKRVQSYFYHSKAHPQKIKKLVSNISDFDYILTDTEFEAFMLECKLIKDLKPHFNRKMKSPQAYTYIRLKIFEGKRTLEMTNCRAENDGNLYFGPYINKHTVEKAIHGIKEAFKINCSNPFMKNGPCLNYSLGMCMGICLGGPALEQFDRIMDQVVALLKGTDLSILEELNQKMLATSDKFDFEAAAKYRNILEAINAIIYKEQIIEFTEENKNIVVVEAIADDVFKLFLIKGNKLLYSEILNNPNTKLELGFIKSKIITYFKDNNLGPSLKVSRDEIDEAQIIYSYLNGGNCSFRIIPDNWLETNKDILIGKSLEELFNQEKALEV
ncbi:UvrB/UvrC motif-containing protein [Neobacillus pocheonensis]|uniref:UvrB/UvrC motif-containing protein n=1 Tax=Neobacillus pocheonensis TaxID=363869 RepID=UPI003D286680